MSHQPGDSDALSVDDEQPESSCETKKCLAEPFVASNNFQSNVVAKKFATIIKEVV